MCGIFALFNVGSTPSVPIGSSPYWDSHGKMLTDNVYPVNMPVELNNLYNAFMKGRGRGPETSKLSTYQSVLLGFHRLAINGLNPESDQPICSGDIRLICNGEIYNYRELYAEMNISPRTGSDCEVIIHLYKKYGMEYTLSVLDGEFAFVLIDGDTAFVARDPFGVRPLYTTFSESEQVHAPIFSSELKMIPQYYPVISTHFQPGTYSQFRFVSGVWSNVFHQTRYFTPGISYIGKGERDADEICGQLRAKFIRAVEKRCECTERPVACLLSGGLDSSLVTSIVCDYRRRCGLPPVETYSIGLEGSEDLRYARIVAEHLGTEHTEIVVSEQDFLDAIPEVIRAIESYDTTTVRASIGNYLLGKYIAAHSRAKVILNGDGSDELMGGYLYMRACPDTLEYDRETRRLLSEIHAFDVLRSDKSISSHGLEPRTPFLDRDFVQYYLSIPAPMRRGGKIEKHWIRRAFDCRESRGEPYLPAEILWRRKEAFSDGVSHRKRSLYEIIQDYVVKMDYTYYTNDSSQPVSFRKLRVSKNPPDTLEQLYYRSIFVHWYPNTDILPHFWMPRYVDAKDASARTLAIYNDAEDQAE